MRLLLPYIKCIQGAEGCSYPTVSLSLQVREGKLANTSVSSEDKMCLGRMWLKGCSCSLGQLMEEDLSSCQVWWCFLHLWDSCRVEVLTGAVLVLIEDPKENLFFIKMVRVLCYVELETILSSGIGHLLLKLLVLNLIYVVVLTERKPVKLSNVVWI